MANKTKAGSRSTTLTYKPKYQLLKTKTSEITLEDIDEICSNIEKGMYLETAVQCAGIDYPSFNLIMNGTAKSYKHTAYLKSAIKQARSNLEGKLTTTWLDKDNSFAFKQAQSFLEVTNPKFSARYRQEFMYNLVFILQNVKFYMEADKYLKFIESISATDDTGVMEDLDEELKKP